MTLKEIHEIIVQTLGVISSSNAIVNKRAAVFKRGRDSQKIILGQASKNLIPNEHVDDINRMFFWANSYFLERKTV